MADDKTTTDPDEPIESPQSEAILKKAFLSAWNIIKTIQVDKDTDPHVVKQKIVEAVSAVNATVNKARQSLPDGEYVDVEIPAIIATAIWCVVFGADGVDVEDVHPYSAGGQVILGFGQACVMFEATVTAEQFAEEDALLIFP